MSYTIHYFGADWCTVCKKVFPAVQDIAARFAIKLEEFDYDMLEEEEKSTITKLPTVRVIDNAGNAGNAETVSTTIITQHADMLEAWLRSHVRVNTSDDF